jgi:hypothetical protein
MDVGMAEAGQSCDEPLHREEEGRPHQDVWQRPCLWGSAPYRWDVDLVIRTPPGQDGRLLGHVAAMLGLFGTCDRLLEPQEGQRFAHWMVIMP